jgi:hypothetical protein
LSRNAVRAIADRLWAEYGGCQARPRDLGLAVLAVLAAVRRVADGNRVLVHPAPRKRGRGKAPAKLA